MPNKKLDSEILRFAVARETPVSTAQIFQGLRRYSLSYGIKTHTRI